MENPNTNLLITESPNIKIIPLKNYKKPNLTTSDNTSNTERPLSSFPKQKRIFDFQNPQYMYPYNYSKNSYLRNNLERYMNDIILNPRKVEPYIVPYTPKMINIINKNKNYVEKVQNNIWEYKHLLPKPKPYKRSKLMQIISNQFYPYEVKMNNIIKKKKIELYRPNYFKKF